jgi:glycosyltransferase involved in cell wall biosynthesis
MTVCRLAVVASHPVQYQAPWYRELAARVDLTVFFAHRATAADQARAGFGVPFEWDVPMYDGYRHAWLNNVAAQPSVDAFRGCDTPAIREIVASKRFDAVLVNGWQLLSYWQAARAARRAGIPVLVRGDSQLHSGRGAIVRAVKRVVYPRLLGAFDEFLAVGRRNAEYYRHYGIPPHRIFASPHCVDNAFFSSAAAAARVAGRGLRTTLGLRDDDVVFLFAGKLIDKKRPLDFLHALDLARRTHPRVVGLIVGDGPLREAVEEHRERQGTACAIAGFLNQRQIGAAYAAADALVLPSDGRETWGLVVNEAMACGVPPIVSDEAGCAPDLVLDGRTGLSYRCGDVEALAACIGRLARDGAFRRDLSTAAASHIESYSPAAAADGVAAALRSVNVMKGQEAWTTVS